MTSTLSKLMTVSLAIMFLTGLVLGNYGQGYSDYGIQSTDFVLPDYDSHEQIILEFLAPFLLISIILQLAYARVLHSIYKDEEVPAGMFRMVESENKPDVSRYATLMALATTAMMIPTGVFHWINEYIALVFGSIIYIAIAVVFFLFLYIVAKILINLF